MSFTNNCSNIDKIPGPVRNNPMNGICERACIEVNKVFDACMKQETMQNVSLAMRFVDEEATYKEPLKFISAKTDGESKITDLVITPSEEDRCFARVTCNIFTELTIVFIDADGKEGLGKALFKVPMDVMLHVSAPSLTPYHIESMLSAVCPEGSFINEQQLVVTACMTAILKVVMKVDLLVPTYGYCYIPPCQEYTEEACDGVFDLPLFPGECGVEGRCKNC